MVKNGLAPFSNVDFRSSFHRDPGSKFELISDAITAPLGSDSESVS